MASHPLAHGLFHSCQVAVRVHRRTRPVALTFRDTLQFQLFGPGCSSLVGQCPVGRGTSLGRKGPLVRGGPFFLSDEPAYSRLVPRTHPLAADPLISRIDTSPAFLPEITPSIQPSYRITRKIYLAKQCAIRITFHSRARVIFPFEIFERKKIPLGGISSADLQECIAVYLVVLSRDSSEI